MSVAERILASRKQKGISQEELAHKIGVSRQAVSKWESGQSIPDVEKVVALSRYFGVTTDYLLNAGGEPDLLSNEDAGLTLLKDGVDDDLYRYAVMEHDKKRRAGYWLKVMLPWRSW